MAELDPLFLKTHSDAVANAMLEIAGAENCELDTRHLAMEYILTLYESRAALLRRTPKVPDRAIPILLQWMIELDEVRCSCVALFAKKLSVIS